MVFLSSVDIPEIPYEYSCVTPFDMECGTHNLETYLQKNNPQCPDEFVCTYGATDIGEMATCIHSMNCAMLSGMTVFYGDDGMDSLMNDIILFLREMIPHHQNAVNMAKNLFKSGEVKCSSQMPGGETTPACLLDPILRSIINVQNSQIQTMQSLLESFGVTENQDCVEMHSDISTSNAEGAKPQFEMLVSILAGLVLTGFTY